MAVLPPGRGLPPLRSIGGAARRSSLRTRHAARVSPPTASRHSVGPFPPPGSNGQWAAAQPARKDFPWVVMGMKTRRHGSICTVRTNSARLLQASETRRRRKPHPLTVADVGHSAEILEFLSRPAPITQQL